MNNKLDIIFFGDSLTLGYGVCKQNSWVYKLTQHKSLSSLNKACNGDTTTAMLTRYSNDVIKYTPSSIFLMGGSNDLLLGRKVSFIISNIEIMINDGLAIGSKVILGIPPKIISNMANSLFSASTLYSYAEKELLSLKDELIKLCDKYAIEFINFYDLIPNRNDLYLDGIHMNSTGNNLMYENALNYF